MKSCTWLKSFVYQVNNCEETFYARQITGKTKKYWLQLGRRLQWFSCSREGKRGNFLYKKNQWVKTIPYWLYLNDHQLALNIVCYSDLFLKVLQKSLDQDDVVSLLVDELNFSSKKMTKAFLYNLGLIIRRESVNSNRLSGLTINGSLIRKIARLTDKNYDDKLKWLFPLVTEDVTQMLSDLQRLYIILIENWLINKDNVVFLYDERGIFHLPINRLYKIIGKSVAKKHGFTKKELDHLIKDPPTEISFESSRRENRVQNYLIIRPPKIN